MQKFSLKSIRHLDIVGKVFYMRKRITLLEDFIESKDKRIKDLNQIIDNKNIIILEERQIAKDRIYIWKLK